MIIQFVVNAVAVDKIKNPNPTNKACNFNYGRSRFTSAPAPVKKPTLPEQPLSITLLSQSPNLQGEGEEYFNIKKPAGGYITFKFNTNSGSDAIAFNGSNYGVNVIINSEGSPVASSYIQGVNTNYTYEYTVENIGTFRLLVKYRPYGFSVPPTGGEVLEQLVYSPPFTL